MSEIYILLPVHNRKEITRKFIDCLNKQTYKKFKLVVIDDGSTDGTSEMVGSELPSSIILQGNGNLWWAGSLQLGIDWIKSQSITNDSLILFINDDVGFSEDYLQNAIDVMSNRESVMMLSWIINRDGMLSESGINANLKELTFNIASHPSAINCLSTRGLFVYWRDVLKIGSFHTNILPHYLSDYEYTIRAYKKGIKCESSSKLVISPIFDATGYHQIKAQNVSAYIKNYFSKKYSMNPIYWTVFVFLTTSIWEMPINFYRIWANALKDLLNFIFSPKKQLK